MNVTVICDRCKQQVAGIKTETATGGFYAVGKPGSQWGRYANPGEFILCDACVGSDPRYLAEYGRTYP